MGMGHDNDSGQCASHAMFENLVKQSLDSLSKRLCDGIEVLRNQNESTTKALEKNADALDKVLENQADRRELCGRQGSRIEALEKSDTQQWKDIMDLRKKVYMATGAIVIAQVLVAPLFWLAFKIIFKVGS